MSDTLKVFTAKSVDRLLSEGGSSAWKLARSRALKQTYVVCYRNQLRVEEIGNGPTPEPHGAAFLIGKIGGVVEAPGEPDRNLVLFSDYALLDTQDWWAGDRNPTIYADISNLNIDPTALEWHPMPEPRYARKKSSRDGLSIEQAKRGLAQWFNVSEDQVRIIIEA